jgi:hypothetical protein
VRQQSSESTILCGRALLWCVAKYSKKTRGLPPADTRRFTPPASNHNYPPAAMLQSQSAMVTLTNSACLPQQNVLLQCATLVCWPAQRLLIQSGGCLR